MRRWLLRVSVFFLIVDFALLGTVVYLERTKGGALFRRERLSIPNG